MCVWCEGKVQTSAVLVVTSGFKNLLLYLLVVCHEQFAKFFVFFKLGPYVFYPIGTAEEFIR